MLYFPPSFYIMSLISKSSRIFWNLARSTTSIGRSKNMFFQHSPLASFQNRFCATAPPTSPILGTKAREAYLFVYTCKVCGNRSERKISKRAYHHGVVLVKCPGCEKNHLVADNLKWFDDNPITIEDIMKAQGETVVKGTCNHAAGQHPDVSSTSLEDIVHIEGADQADILNRISLQKE